MPLGRELFLKQRGLLGEPALGQHQLDRIVAEHDGGARHFADLVLSLGAANLDVGVVGGEAVHIAGETQERARHRAADIEQRRDHQHAGKRHGDADQPHRLPVGLGDAA